VGSPGIGRILDVNQPSLNQGLWPVSVTLETSLGATARPLSWLGETRDAIHSAGSSCRIRGGAAHEEIDVMKIDEGFGLPAHPLFVHIPLVLIPLAALGMLIMAVVPRTRARLGWPTVAVAGVAVFFAWMAKGSGSKLALRVDPDPKLTHHIQMGNTMYLVALVFFVLVTAFVVVDRRMAAQAEDDGRAGGDQTRRSARGPAVAASAPRARRGGGRGVPGRAGRRVGGGRPRRHRPGRPRRQRRRLG